MIEQYDKEISQIHASPELIKRTKAAMQQEENRIHYIGEKVKAGNKEKMIWTLGIAAVAIALLFAVFPKTIGNLQELSLNR